MPSPSIVVMLSTLVHDRERQAGSDPPPIDDHRARAALALIAALLGAGEKQALAQRIEQRGPRVEFELAGHAVHREGNLRHGRRFDGGSLDAGGRGRLGYSQWRAPL